MQPESTCAWCAGGILTARGIAFAIFVDPSRAPITSKAVQFSEASALLGFSHQAEVTASVYQLIETLCLNHGSADRLFVASAPLITYCTPSASFPEDAW